MRSLTVALNKSSKCIIISRSAATLSSSPCLIPFSYTLHHLDSTIRRTFTIRPTPSSSQLDPLLDPDTASEGSSHKLASPGALTPDATFTTLGPSSNLLQIQLTASQPLHTRRGTLLALSGTPNNITSRLSPLTPLKRFALNLPFIYQRITSTTSSTLLLAARAPTTSFAVLSLDGRIDWRILQRRALVAWSGSGSSLTITPAFTPSTPGLANWSTQLVTGRGLVALAARSAAYETRLKNAEEFLAHPSAVVAYSVGPHQPEPYRLSHSNLRLSIPTFGRYLPETKFIRAVRESETWRLLGRALFRLRMWMRTVLWGERVYLRFRGPGTVVLQGRGGAGALREAFEGRELQEWADSPAGSMEKSVSVAARTTGDGAQGAAETAGSKRGGGGGGDGTMRYASVGKDGKVAWVKE